MLETCTGYLAVAGILGNWLYRGYVGVIHEP